LASQPRYALQLWVPHVIIFPPQEAQCPSSVPPQLFNEVAEAELTLQNSGKVGFQYQVLSPSDSLLPGVPLVLPSVVSTGQHEH